jgi:uncharacterized protein (TIGR02145 family)
MKPNNIEEVKIGSQVWMKSNLGIENYQNGDEIIHAKTLFEWIEAGKNKQGAWCYYENSNDSPLKGKLYNWHAVNDPRGIAPEGWQIPSEQQALELLRSVGISFDEFGDYELTNRQVNSFLLGGSNEIGFDAIKTGKRNNDGKFIGVNLYAAWWTKDENVYQDEDDNVDDGIVFYLELEEPATSWYKSNGYPIRCIKL